MRITGQVRAYCLKDEVEIGGNWMIGTTSSLTSIREIVFDGEHLLSWTSESAFLSRLSLRSHSSRRRILMGKGLVYSYFF